MGRRDSRGCRWEREQYQGGHGCQFQCQEVGFPHQCRVRLCVVTRAPRADGQKTGLLQPSPPSPPPGLCVPMLGGSRLYRGGDTGHHGEMVATVRFSFQGSRPSQLRRPASRLRAAPRGSRCGGVDSSLQDILGSLSGDAVSHGYGLATVSGERAWLCPQFPPLPEWLRPPPARGHPVSSRGRIERHGAHKATKDAGGTRRGVPI